ncbi:MAG: response regulator [Lachnospiraceae bacterium]|nr:response regulator [Lachnospiraceae bacterium]
MGDAKIGILIADDEPIERLVLGRKLGKLLGSDSGCEIISAANGKEALQFYYEKKPGVMILDIRMPGLSGLEVAEKVREEDRDCVIIFLTAFDEFSYARKAITVRALDYLLKPCEEAELFTVVEEALRIAELRKASREKNVDIPKGTDEKEGTAEAEGPPEDRRQAFIREYIEKNYMRDLSIQEIADQLGYSEVYFCRIFKQSFGQSFVSYLTNYRIGEACRLLREERVSVREAGIAVGYMDSNYFTKVFRRIRGVTPSEYRAGQ